MEKTTPVQFLKEVKQELLKVVWPTKEETIRLTLVVIAVSLIVGVFIGGLDYFFAKFMALILKR